MGTQAGTTGPPPPYPSSEHPYTDVDRPRGVFYPPRVFDRDNSGASLFHDQSHRHELGNWHADRQRHKDFQRGHNNQNGHSSYQHRRNNKPNWYNNDRQYHDNQHRRNDDQHRHRDNQYWHNNDHRNAQSRYNVRRYTGYNNQFNRRRASSIQRDNTFTHQHQPSHEHLEEGLRNSDEDEMTKDASGVQEMGDSTPSCSGALAAQPFLRLDRTPGEQAWEDGYEQVDDESGQSTPHSHRVASLRNDEDTQSRRTLSPQALTPNLTYNPWD
ncbi:hypothetical protein BDN71DRAFT_1132185 [Pleurotus eryngii]|uniref:Uncharacterized protein n=1 Tax=Pleurotus eryngii TaxID=5323 RepID=A0A9P6A5S1_PLEER|nr:hypothetical protein BDN71DRAFT_1132185 [Pleurotus eryngii]